MKNKIKEILLKYKVDFESNSSGIMVEDFDSLAEELSKFTTFPMKIVNGSEMEKKNMELWEDASEWWNDLTDDETIEVYKRTGNFRMGGWGYDIGPTQEDVLDMYKYEFNINF